MKLRKFFKVSGIILLVLAVLLTCFHFWFIHRSVGLLQDFVKEQSGGRYNLKIKKLRYNYARLIFQLDEPVLTCLDTTSLQDKYDVSARRVTINLKQLLPLILKKELRFDSVFVDAPQINILHRKFKDSTASTKQLNISQDMFTAYSSLRNALGQLQVDKFTIQQGAFSVQNGRIAGQQPLEIHGIDFAIKGLNIKAGQTPVYDPLAITDSIGLAISGQTIVFPDGQKSIGFKSFRYNSVLGALTLDSLQVISNSDTTANNFDISAGKLSLKKFRLVSRNGDDYTEIDSVFFTKPVAKLVLEAKDKKKDSASTIASTLRKVVETITGNGAINYIGINNVVFDITTLKNDKESNFSFVQDKLEIGNVLLNKDSITPVSIGSLRFGLKHYINYFNDSAYLIQFDSVRILNGQLALYDFQLQSTPRLPQLQRIRIPVLLLNSIDWYRLIFEKRFVAKSIALYDPQITLTITEKKGGNGNALQKLKQFFSVDHILLQNAGIKVLFSKNEYAEVKQLSIDAIPNNLLENPSATALLASLKGLNAQNITVVKDGWKAAVSRIKISDSSGLQLPSFSIINTSKKIQASGENLRISKLSVDENANRITMGTLSWKNLTATIFLPEKQEEKKTANPLSLLIAGISGGPVKLHISNAKLDAMANLESLHTGQLAVSAGRLDTLKNLAVKGNNWHFANETITADGGVFSFLQRKPSELTGIELTEKQPGKVITAILPEINFSGDLEKAAQQQFIFDYFKINRPQISVSITNPPKPVNTSATAEKAFPFIQLRQAEINHLSAAYVSITNRDTLQVHLNDVFFSTGIFSSNNEINLRNAKMLADSFTVIKNDSLFAGLNNGKINATAGSFSFYKNADNSWKLNDAGLLLTNAELRTKKDSGRADTLLVPSFAASHFSASEKEIKDWRMLVFGQPALQLQNITIRYRNRDNIFMIDDLNTVIGSNKITLSSFLYHPQLNEEAFVKAHYYETDFIRAKTGKIVIYNFDRAAFIRDSALPIRHISAEDVDFRDTRDKTPPFLANVIKPLPVSLINKIPFAVAIDSVTLQNAHVEYKEVSEKTGMPGTIYFSGVQSQFLNLKNRNQTIRDTFSWESHAMMMDSMPFFMGIKAAYKDTLDKLQLTVRLRPTDLTLLNPFFAPLQAIKFKSARLDTLEMVALANDYIAHGTMKFFYHDLKVEFLSNSDTAKKTLLKSIITFLANKLIIKKNNDSRISTVYFERIRDRSVFNYIVKMVFTGMGSSIGVKKSKKLEKAYRKKLVEMHWLPLEE